MLQGHLFVEDRLALRQPQFVKLGQQTNVPWVDDLEELFKKMSDRWGS